MNIARLVTATCFIAGLLALPACAAPAATSTAPAAVVPAVQPEALEALSKMSAHLRTLTAFELRGDTVREEVFDNDQKLQFMGSVTYKAKKPNGLSIVIAEDRRLRQFYFNGKTLTVFSPRMGFYATVPAPSTIRKLLDELNDKYGIVLPLEDLFLWGTDGDRRESLQAGNWVGYARVAGQDADQYAFREEGIDWQIWIARGDKPLPLRVVIANVDDPGKPQFEANMTWDTAPKFAADTFTFKPPADAKPIPIETKSR